MRGDDVTFALIEMRRVSDRSRRLETQARLARLAARREGRRVGSRRPRFRTVRPAATGVRVWMRTSWHTLSGHRAGERPHR